MCGRQGSGKSDTEPPSIYLFECMQECMPEPSDATVLVLGAAQSGKSSVRTLYYFHERIPLADSVPQILREIFSCYESAQLRPGCVRHPNSLRGKIRLHECHDNLDHIPPEIACALLLVFFFFKI